MNQGSGILPSLALAIQRRSLPAAATFVSVILGAVLYLMFAPRQYTGEVKLILKENQTGLNELAKELSQKTEYVPGAVSPLADRAELIKSKDVLKRAIGLVYGYSESEDDNKPTANKLAKQLDINVIPATSILEVSYNNEDPKIAAQLPNAIAEAMIEKSKQDVRSEAQSLREFLEFEVARQETRVTSAEAAENQYRERNGLISLDNQTDNLVDNIHALESQEQDLLAQINQNEEQVRQLTRVVGSSPGARKGATIGQDTDLAILREQLEDLESQLAVSRSRFTAENPELIALQEERDAVAKRYQEKVKQVTGSNQPIVATNDELSQDLVSKLVLTETELASLQKRYATVKIEREKLQRRLQVLPGKIQPLTELVRKRRKANESLQFLQRKLEEARIAEAQLFSDLKIVELADVADSPSTPNPPIVLAMASMAAGILSIGLILLLESLDNTLHSVSEVEQRLDLPMLGAPPSLPQEALSLEHADRFLYDASLVEPYRVFLRNLESRNKGKLNMLVVSSTIPGEGKSVVGSHLAAVSAMLGQRTLLIDGDLRRPKQHTMFNVDFQSGVTDVVEGYITLDQAIKPTNTHNLSLLTCGQLPSLPSTILDAPAMQELLQEASETFDLVIIDTPPVSSCADAHTLSQQSDGLVMVTRPNVTPKDVLSRAVSELKRNGVPIFGFVMNGNVAQTDKYYRYGYDGYYAQEQMMLAPAEKKGKGVAS